LDCLRWRYRCSNGRAFHEGNRARKAMRNAKV
jgi:hypothetical protein